jgi:hypothetical protein
MRRAHRCRIPSHGGWWSLQIPHMAQWGRYHDMPRCRPVSTGLPVVRGRVGRQCRRAIGLAGSAGALASGCFQTPGAPKSSFRGTQKPYFPLKTVLLAVLPLKNVQMGAGPASVSGRPISPKPRHTDTGMPSCTPALPRERPGRGCSARQLIASQPRVLQPPPGIMGKNIQLSRALARLMAIVASPRGR